MLGIVKLEECRWQLLYRAEYSSRYHRRRAAFLSNLDTLFTLVTIVAGASAFGDLMAGSPRWVPPLSPSYRSTKSSCASVLLELRTLNG